MFFIMKQCDKLSTVFRYPSTSFDANSGYSQGLDRVDGGWGDGVGWRDGAVLLSTLDGGDLGYAGLLYDGMFDSGSGGIEV